MILMDTLLAHVPVAGVKIYLEVPANAVLIVAGAQVPLIPLMELKGSTGAVLF